jgi:hypothetical protein
MPFLSLGKEAPKDCRAIAVVRGGDYDGDILYLHEDDAQRGKRPKKEVEAHKYEKDLKEMKPTHRVQIFNRIQEAIAKGIPPEKMVGETDQIKSLYRRIQNDMARDTSLRIGDDSTFQLIPNPDPKKREVWYIAGASGSGKSYIARQLAENYKKLFPSRDIYLISKLQEDSTLDTMKIGKPKRINIQSLVDDYPSIDEFKDCMVIFDDYDTFQGAEGKTVQTLIDDLAIQGRHTNTTMLCLTHYITNYKKTRLLLNEASHFVIYPQATSYHALKYLLATHIGMEQEKIKALRSLGRWICVSKNYPQYLVSQHTAEVLHQE